MGEYEYQLVQEIKALRSDIQKLPDELVTKLAKAIDRELRPFFYTIAGLWVLSWLYLHFWPK
jgi:hypothetical protein